MNKQTNYQDGISGELKSVYKTANGALLAKIEKSNGVIQVITMTKRYPNVDQVEAKAKTLIGKQIMTRVSKTTSSWDESKYFADIYEL